MKFFAETYYNQGDTMLHKEESSNYDLRESKFGVGFAGTMRDDIAVLLLTQSPPLLPRKKITNF
jgi:hypothetical protein